MKVKDYDGKTTKQVEFYTKDERYIGFRFGENAWAIAADEDDPNLDPDEIMKADIIGHFVDEDGYDSFIVDLV